MSSAAADQQDDETADTLSGPLADPVAEARRLVGRAEAAGLTVRVLGGAAVCLQSPGEKPRLARAVGDIDLVTRSDSQRGVARLLEPAGYQSAEMFNALHGAHRQLYGDPVNHRKLDVFVGGFSMCHTIPIADRLSREPLTIPLAELLLTKLQVVQLTERDRSDIYSLCLHHEIDGPAGSGIEATLIAELCRSDWGLWRTCQGTIDRCSAGLAETELDVSERALISQRLAQLWQRVQDAPKTQRWRLRSRVGERVRWYEEPEEEQAGV